MKRWAFVVAALYLLILAALIAPGIALAFIGKQGTSGGISETYASWQFWMTLLVLSLSQVALLAVPVRMADRRPVARGPVWSTVIASAFMCAVLAMGAAFSIVALIFNDDAPAGDEMNILRLVGAVGLIAWAFWAIVFNRASRKLTADALMRKQSRGLIKGSILELLVAVPTHIVVRQRDACCADMMTFIGIVFGVAVMLFAYGPAVFFLFAARWRRLHPDAMANPPQQAQP
jgi:hypothetical protein